MHKFLLKHFSTMSGRLLVLCLLVASSLAKPRGSKAASPWVADCGRSKYPDAGVEGFIVGGRDARPGENPWQVSLRRSSGSHFCGGVILNSDYILTAAHCVDGDSPSDIAVVVGEHDRAASGNPSRRAYGVSEVTSHPDYNWAAAFDADIALLKLSSSLSFNEDVQPACAPQHIPYTGSTATVSGWGTQQSDGGSLQNVLQQVNLPIPSNDDCWWEMWPVEVTDGMICAGNIPENEKDACQGDSGGPLVIRNSEDRFEVVGLVSWGFGCADGYPGVYARVSAYLDWIASVAQ